jgi:uncharacterized protein YndB with AHSA1/START domain
MSLTVERASPTTLVVTRRFAAPPERVYAAHTEPALLKRWMGGYGGWEMTVCEADPRPGGAFRYRFEPLDGSAGFEITGTYESLDPPRDGGTGRTRHLERMQLGPDAPTAENHVETVFAPDGEGTLLTMTMRVEDPATMDAMVATGMTDGMAWTYDRLDAMKHEPA